MGRPATLLTAKQQKFIDENRKTMTYAEICDTLELKSVFKISKYCQEKGYTKEQQTLNEDQENFIRENYAKMQENHIAETLGVNISQVREFKRSERLRRYQIADKKRDAFDNVFFNVDARECWL